MAMNKGKVEKRREKMKKDAPEEEKMCTTSTYIKDTWEEETNKCKPLSLSLSLSGRVFSQVKCNTSTSQHVTSPFSARVPGHLMIHSLQLRRKHLPFLSPSKGKRGRNKVAESKGQRVEERERERERESSQEKRR